MLESRPMLALLALAVLPLVAGCRHAPTAPVVISAGVIGGETPCVDRLIARARSLGHLESDVDRDAGFFRIELQTQKGRKAQMMVGSGYFLNVQCSPDGSTASVSAYMGTRKVAGRIRKELGSLTEQLEGY